jgi:hypothetical protein
MNGIIENNLSYEEAFARRIKLGRRAYRARTREFGSDRGQLKSLKPFQSDSRCAVNIALAAAAREMGR